LTPARRQRQRPRTGQHGSGYRGRIDPVTAFDNLAPDCGDTVRMSPPDTIA
jgi:hypothetical protein